MTFRNCNNLQFILPNFAAYKNNKNVKVKTDQIY